MPRLVFLALDSPMFATHRLFWLAFATFCMLNASSSFAQRDLQEIPEPNTDKELASMQVLDGAQASLFAGSDHLAKPIHMNFGIDGKLWVATSETYPQIKPGDTASDKVVVLQDTDGDGVCDKSTVFADDLLIPTGILPDVPNEKGQGVYVAASTQLLYFLDKDGDNVADERKIVLDGFGTEDTHHLLHTLRWGPDGCIYMNQSIYIHSHVPTRYGIKHLNGGGVWRFDPRTDELTVLAKGFVNPWGHVFTPNGQSFGTDGAYYEGINHIFPGSVFATSPGATRWLRGLNPGSPKHCGLEILPVAQHEDSFEFITADFRSHRVNRFQVSRTDSGYVSIAQADLIRSEHIAFRPIDIKLGGNGDLYIADWYNPIIQHGEVDFRDDRRDTKNGRIWRVKLDAAAETKSPAFASVDSQTADLLRLLDSPSVQHQTWARLLIAQRWNAETSKLISNWLDDSEANSYESRLLNVNWIRGAAGALKIEHLEPLLHSQNGEIRAAAVRMVANYFAAKNEALTIASATINDSDWLVRLETICLLQTISDLKFENTASIAFQALDLPMNDSIDFALWQLVRSQDRGLQSELVSPAASVELASNDQQYDWLQNLSTKHLSFVVSSNPNPKWIEQIIIKFEQLPLSEIDDSLISAIAKHASPDVNARLIHKLEASFDSDTGAGASSWKAANVLLKSLTIDDKTRTAIEPLARKAIAVFQATTFANEQQQDAVVATVAQLAIFHADLPQQAFLEKLLGQSTSQDTLQTIARSLATLGTAGEKSLSSIGDSEQNPIEQRVAAVLALSEKDLDAAITVAVKILGSANADTETQRSLTSVFSRKEGVNLLAANLAKRDSLSPETARSLLAILQGAAINSSELSERIAQLGKLDEHRWVYNTELVQKIRERIESGKSDAARGEALYRQTSIQCVRCHQIGTAGGNIGPNLISLGGSSQLDYIVESLIAPDAKLKEGYKTVVVLLESDEVITGLEKSRTEKEIVLQTAEGKLVNVSTDDIAEEKLGGSLMPVGLLDRLPLEDLADLSDFLSQLGRTQAYTVSTERWIRNWNFLKGTDEIRTFFNRHGIDKATDDNDDMLWVGITTQVNGSIPLAEADTFSPHGSQEAIQVFEAELDCKRAGEVQLRIVSTERVNVFIDGKPVLHQEPFSLGQGKHRLVALLLSDGEGEFGIAVEDAGERPAIVDISANHAVGSSGVHAQARRQRTRSLKLVSAETQHDNVLNLSSDETIAIVGDDIWEQIGNACVFETLLRTTLPNKSLHLRNLSWAGDDVTGAAQAVFGETKDGYQRRLQQVDLVEPTVVLTCFGRNEALNPEWTVASFAADYKRFLADLDRPGRRLIVIVPPSQEFGNVADENSSHGMSTRFAEFTAAVRNLCVEQNYAMLDLPTIKAEYIPDGFRFSEKGLIDLSIDWTKTIVGANLDEAAEETARGTFYAINDARYTKSGPTIGADQFPQQLWQVYQIVQRKRQNFFNGFRPANETYLFLFRKHEQGNNAVEAEEMRNIAKQLDIQVDALLTTTP